MAKRKNKYLIETTRTFLIHGEIPQHFMGDAFFYCILSYWLYVIFDFR